MFPGSGVHLFHGPEHILIGQHLKLVLGTMYCAESHYAPHVLITLEQAISAPCPKPDYPCDGSTRQSQERGSVEHISYSKY